MTRRWWIFLGAVGFALAVTLGAFWLLRGQDRSQPQMRQTAQPGIAYLSPVGASEVWLQELDGSPARQLTSTGGRVTGLEALPDGQRLAAVVVNAQNGSDLYLLRWDGAEFTRLVACGADLCAEPRVSPDGRWLAYTRQAADAAYPIAWLVDLSNGAAQPLELDALISALNFRWSPDSRFLAFYDPSSDGVRVREMQSGAERILGSNVPQVGSWSADSRSITVNVEEFTDGFASMKVYVFDIASNDSRLLLGDAPDDASDYSVPQWSPDGQWLAYARRVLTGSPARQIWVIRPDGSGARAVTEDLAQAHGAPRWSPDGGQLLFQRIVPGSSTSLPELVVWDQSSDALRVIAQNATNPVWLP